MTLWYFILQKKVLVGQISTHNPLKIQVLMQKYNLFFYCLVDDFLETSIISKKKTPPLIGGSETSFGGQECFNWIFNPK